MKTAPAAIVDYGLGNLFSIEQACRKAGILARVTDRPAEIARAALVILPGVGAFGDAMRELRRRDLVSVLRAHATSGRMLFGVCLGMQLLMDESQEFGTHRGLGLIPGVVERLPGQPGMKVPQIGWSKVDAERSWEHTPLAGVATGSYFYFVHSFHVRPADPHDILASSAYGGTSYCSAIQRGSVFGVQFHPEKSGPTGLSVYAGFARFTTASDQAMTA
jgi:imidazole glycerol-phosphate synthase subunit HisH